MSQPPAILCKTTLVLFALLAVPASGQVASITAAASTTFAPVVSEAAQTYHETYPDLTIKVENMGSFAGADAVQAGTAAVAFVDTAPSSTATPPLTAQRIFALPLAIAISPQAGVTALTRAQAAAVFNGGYKSWQDLGGADLPIRIFTRPPQSAMSTTFQNVFGVLPRSGEVMVGSTEVTSAIRATPGGVGFTTYAAARASGLPIATIDGFAPGGPLGTTAYPFYAIGWVVTNGPPSPALSRFLAFVETRRPILAKYGIVSVRDLR